MKLEMLAQVLVDADLGEIGQTIFVHHMPETLNQGVLLRTPLVGTPVDHYLPGYYKGRVQAIVRAITQTAGDELAIAVIKALQTLGGTTLTDAETDTSLKINYLRPDTLPIVFPRSEGNLKEWSINFDCCYVQAII